MSNYTTITLKTKLLDVDASVLTELISAYTMACNFALSTAKELKQFNRVKLHHEVYHPLRSMFGLSANHAVTAIRRVAKKKGFKAKAFKAKSIDFDARTLSLKGDVLSITTLEGRNRFRLALSDYHQEMLNKALSVQGGVLVKHKQGDWYIHLQLRLPIPEVQETGKIIGVDVGQKILAVTTNGMKLGKGSIKSKRIQYRNKRAEVQSKRDTKRTYGLKQLAKRLSGKEKRFVAHTLHVAAKEILNTCEAGDTVAIEDLTNLRKKTERWGKQARYEHALFPYYRFRQYLEYKAALKGVKVIAVSPMNTSKTCSRCGHCDKANRKSQALFRCTECGFQDNADQNAARNIAMRAGSISKGQCKVPRDSAKRPNDLNVNRINHISS